MKYAWMSGVGFNANSVEKMQVFCPWSSFRISAWTVPRTFSKTQARIFSASVVLGARLFSALNTSSCWAMAVFRNIARIAGAGPLMVIETEVEGLHRSKPP